MVKIFLTIRNHWKKSLLGAGIAAYSVNYGLIRKDVNNLMRTFCESAVVYGDAPVSSKNLRRITVVLNPAANKRQSKKNFEKYCAPLLHLSGVYVDVKETEREGHGRDIIDTIDPKTDAIVVAGGDGTVSEIVTGLMRSRGELCQIPIGVLPLGKTNTLARKLFGANEYNKYTEMAAATMAIIKGTTKPIHAFRIEVLQNSKEAEKGDKPPVYGVSGVEWGVWREVKRRQDQFWYFGPLKILASLIFPGDALEKSLIKAKVRYTKPCNGCSVCYTQRPDIVSRLQSTKPVATSKWWNVSSLKKRRQQITAGDPEIDYTSIVNETCNVVEEMTFRTTDLAIQTSNDPSVQMTSEAPHVLLSIGPSLRYQGKLLMDGIRALRDGRPVVDTLAVKQIEIRPLNREAVSEEENLAIDNEDYEVRPIKLTILPNAVKVFCL